MPSSSLCGGDGVHCWLDQQPSLGLSAQPWTIIIRDFRDVIIAWGRYPPTPKGRRIRNYCTKWLLARLERRHTNDRPSQIYRKHRIRVNRCRLLLYCPTRHSHGIVLLCTCRSFCTAHRRYGITSLRSLFCDAGTGSLPLQFGQYRYPKHDDSQDHAGEDQEYNPRRLAKRCDSDYMYQAGHGISLRTALQNTSVIADKLEIIKIIALADGPWRKGCQDPYWFEGVCLEVYSG